MSLEELIHILGKIIKSWVKYHVWGLSLGVSIAMSMLNLRMSKCFQDMVHIFLYMDDVLMIRDDTFENHMYIIDYVLHCSENSIMIINTVKHEWDWNSIGYLLFLVKNDGIKP